MIRFIKKIITVVLIFSIVLTNLVVFAEDNPGIGIAEMISENYLERISPRNRAIIERETNRLKTEINDKDYLERLSPKDREIIERLEANKLKLDTTSRISDLEEETGGLKGDENVMLMSIDGDEENSEGKKYEVGESIHAKGKYFADENSSAKTRAISSGDSRAVSASDFESVIRPSYANGVNHPHLSGRSEREYVSPFDGTLQVNYTDITLPGRNGLDLNITRFFKSELADVEASNAVNNTLEVNPTTYLNKRYALGIGWSFGFPSVEVRKKADGTTQAFYHDGTGACYRSNYDDPGREAGEDYNANQIYGSNLDNYYSDEVIFKERDRSYTRDNYESEYSFKTADGTMQYFGKDGEILSIKDRFDNEIKFDYVNLPGENILPFHDYRKFSLENYWYIKKGVLYYDAGNKLPSTGVSSGFVDIDELYEGYYISLIYEAITDINASFDGKFQVYCDLYWDNEKITEVLIAEEKPNSWNEIKTITENLSIADLNLIGEVNRMKLRIETIKSSGKIGFSELRISPKVPMISKITDTIGRTVEFDYGDGDLYGHYEDDVSLPMYVAVRDALGNKFREFTYYRSVLTYSQYDGNDNRVLRHRFYRFDGCTNGDYSTWVYYEGRDGRASSWYSDPHINYSYEFWNRLFISCITHRNSNTYFTYEKVTKWTDNRPMGSTVAATVDNTGFLDTWRVISKYDINDSADANVSSPEINKTTYNYKSGYYTDETGYTRKERYGSFPGFINPEYGTYIVKVTNPNGSVETYEYTSHSFTVRKLKREIDLPLLDKKTISESASTSSDFITEEYTYSNSFSTISPTMVKVTERNNGSSRAYYTKTEYDTYSCLPVKVSLPLTEDEAEQNTIPAEKCVTTAYKEIGNKIFLPIYKKYYQSDGGELLTESFTYDSLGRVLSETNAAGETTKYQYHYKYQWMPSQVSFYDPERTGDSSRVSYMLYEYSDNYGLGPTWVAVLGEDGDLEETYYYYESRYGKVYETIYESGAETLYIYDGLGRVKELYYPSYNAESGTGWLVERYTYYNWGQNDGYFRLEVKKDLNIMDYYNNWEETTLSTETSYYDDYGNIHYRNKDGINEYFYYDTANRLIRYRNHRDVEKGVDSAVYTYDGFNRVKSVTDALGNKQQAVYKNLSTDYSFIPAGSTVLENHYTENYDMYGRKISESVYPNGLAGGALTTSYEYDLLGNVLKITDANGKVTQTEYDKLNNPIKVTKADGSTVETEYTKWGTAKKVTQTDGNQPYSIAQTYNNGGKVTSHSQKGLAINTRPWYYNYNNVGEIAKVTDPNGNARSYEYDQMGNNTVFENGSQKKEMQYNHFGQLDKVTRTSNGYAYGVIDYTYNEKGWLTSVNDNGKILNYTYDSIGDVASVTPSSSLKRTYTRDKTGKITKVGAGGKSFQYQYYGDGLIKKLTYPGGITSEYTYDNANRLKTLITKKGTTILNSYTYEYDNIGNILSISGTENVTYTYDNLYRLSSETRDGVTTSYAYDSRGNLISERRPGYGKTYEYGGDNRLYKTVENGKTTKYEYDLNGNMIKRGEDRFSYDENDKLVYSKVNGKDTYYEIGVDGLRRSKRVNGVTTNYEVDQSGNVIKEGENDIIIGHRPLAKEISSKYYYYIYNGHGDVVSILDESGNVVNSYEYDAWGNILSETETIENSHKYAGEYVDLESDLIYLRNRMYDPSIKRFIQEDPARDDLNWYAYCGNNPVNFVDPTGCITQKEQEMYKNGQMAPMAYSYLMNLTYHWYLADTEEDKAMYHQMAEEFRANDYKTTNGAFPEVDAGIEYMPSRPNDYGGAIPLSMDEHYFRNQLNLSFSWKDFQKLQERIPDNMQWTTVIATLHQNHTVNGKQNVKYVSADGHFELIYNGNNELLTSHNNPDDMGTYNYYSPVINPYYHSYYDIIPYLEYGNVR